MSSAKVPALSTPSNADSADHLPIFLFRFVKSGFMYDFIFRKSLSSFGVDLLACSLVDYVSSCHSPKDIGSENAKVSKNVSSENRNVIELKKKKKSSLKTLGKVEGAILCIT